MAEQNEVEGLGPFAPVVSDYLNTLIDGFSADDARRIKSDAEKRAERHVGKHVLRDGVFDMGLDFPDPVVHASGLRRELQTPIAALRGGVGIDTSGLIITNSLMSPSSVRISSSKEN